MTTKIKQSYRKCDRVMKRHAENSEASGMNRVRNTSPRSDRQPPAERIPVLFGIVELRGRANDENTSIGQAG
ncbi:hypothetical protein [Burkholderia metallica]